ncbi:MAG: hypothetical protein KBA13_08885 [Chitinophagales bacterium]|nr:hypothetical protein [Chitinophagales bacterium]
MQKNINLCFYFLAIFLFSNCSKTSELGCEGFLFGSPIGATGLNKNQCKPICECKSFNSKIFTNSDLTELKKWTITKPFDQILTNPYNQPLPVAKEGVCAVIVDTFETKKYHLEFFDDAEKAKTAGAFVTHYDNCGVCSTLEDLAVYAGNIDIGSDVKKCGLQNLNAPIAELISCIQELGFTLPCAQIWAYNTRNTQKKCLEDCLKNEPYNTKNGGLNPCLACDERESGPVFKVYAGRTRRNTGIASSICRKCEEVQPVEHNYPR